MKKGESPGSERRYYRPVEKQHEFWETSGYMSEKICQDEPSLVRIDQTKTRQREDYRSFFLKKSTWDAIRISRGWPERGSISRFAEEIGVTRQYAADLVSCNCGCSSNVMRKIIDLLGIRDGERWCHLFDKTNMRNVDNNHPIFNQAKYMGEVPYERFSISATLRESDYAVESRNI